MIEFLLIYSLVGTILIAVGMLGLYLAREEVK